MTRYTTCTGPETRSPAQLRQGNSDHGLGFVELELDDAAHAELADRRARWVDAVAERAGARRSRWNRGTAAPVHNAMLNLPTLRVLAAVLLIDPDDPDDADDLEAAGLLLARRVEREAAREEALPNRPRLRVVR